MENKNHTNRLNANESRIWDRCFRYFVRTGEWLMGMYNDVPFRNRGDVAKITDNDLQMLEDMDENPTPFEAPMVEGGMRKSFMPDPSRRGRYPTSRDWELECLLIKCLCSSCIANYKDKCSMPSRIKICPKGRCEGYQKR